MFRDPSYLAEMAINGVLAGGVYALIAVGMTVVFGVLKLFNFGHGAFVTIGLYCGVVAASAGIDPYYAIAAAAILLAVIGVALYYAAIDRVIRAAPLTQVIFTIGMMTALEALIEIGWRADPRVAPSALSGELFFGDVMVSQPRLIAFCASILLTAAFWAFLRWSWWGLAIQAVAQNPQAAQLIGIPRKQALAIAFTLATVAAGLAGLLIAPSLTVTPYAGHVFLGIAFGAVVIGTKGNVFGALIGGLIVGLAESFAVAAFGDDWKEAVIFGLVLVFLLVKPEGLFAGRAHA